MSRSTPLILIADDDKDFREILVSKLSAKGFSIKTASNGAEAVKIAKKILPDLILMDVEMPDKDGVAASLELQQDPHTKNIKVVFVTNLGDSWPAVTEINRRLAQQFGVADYFKKGGDLDVLIEKIRDRLAEVKV